MKKIIGIVLFVFIIAYTAFWYYHANEAKNLTANRLKKGMERLEAQGVRFQHAGLKIGGYPFSYEVKIKNPRWEMPNQEVFVDGFLTLGSNLWGTKVWIKKLGEAYFLDSEKQHHVIVKGDSTFVLNIHNPDRFLALLHPFEKTILDDPKKLLDEIKKFEWNGKNVVVAEGTDSKEKIIEISDFTIALNLQNRGKEIEDYKVDVAIHGLEIGSEGQQFLSKMPVGNFPELADLGIHPSLMYPSGKIDAEFDVAVRAPREGLNGNSPQYFDLNITKLHANSDFGKKNLKLHFKYEQQKNEDTQFHIDFEGITQTSQENYENTAKTFVKDLASAAEDSHNFYREQFQKLLLCCREDLEKILPYIPEIRTKIDLDADYNMAKMLGDITIKHFDFTTNQYGVKSYGEVKGKQLDIRGKYTIALIDYKPLVRDWAAYYNRIHFIIPIFSSNPDEVVSPMSPEMISSTLKFLLAISDEPGKDSKDISITFDFSEPHSVKIGKLTLPEAMVEFKKLEKEWAL